MAIFAGYKPPSPPPPDPDPPPPPPVVEAKRKSAMRPQSLLFDRGSGWTPEKAKRWAKEHGFKADKVDVTDQYVRLRQLDPKGFQVKRTIPFGKGIRAVVAREETMPTKKKKSTRRPAARKSAAKKPKAAPRKAPRRKASKSKKTTATRVVAARRRPRRLREASGRFTVKAKRRRPRRMRETSIATEAKRRRKPRKSAASYVMAKKRKPPRRHPRKVQAWFGDSAGHSKAAKKGWVTRKGGRKSKKTTKTATESRRRPRRMKETSIVAAKRRRPKSRRTRETRVVAAKRRHPRRMKETSIVAAKRRRPKGRRTRETRIVAAKRRPKRAVRETGIVRTQHRRVRAMPSFSTVKRSALTMGLELGTGVAGYLVADVVDRFLATYDPAAAAKAGPNKFTSDGTGMLGNSLNVASPPDLVRYGALGVLTLLPLGGSLFVKHPELRASTEGFGIGAGIKLVTTLWSHLLMPMLVGKDVSAPALQKSWVARLYPAEVSAVLNIKSGKAAVSSGGAASTAGVLSGGSDRDAGPFALAGRFGGERREERRGWVSPAPWQTTTVPTYDPSVAVDPSVPVAAPVWPAHFGERHRWGLRGVGDAVQAMTDTIATQTGVHPAHAVNAAMHAAAEPHDLTQALERALPHVNRRVLHETARHLHPHVVRMHAHARHPREHGEWTAERAAEGFPAPDHDAPEHEWREWHGKRAAAGLSPAPHPPSPPPATPPTPVHLRSRSEWRPNYNREITYERYPTTQQAMGIGAGGPATSGYPGQPGLGDTFADAAQAVAATVPNMPLENAVNVAAYAAAEPCDLVRAFERAMPSIKRALAVQCAEQVGPHINRMIEQTGVPLAPDAPLPPAAPDAPAPPIVTDIAPPAPPVIEFVPSPPPPSWTRSEAEWHEQERHDWEHSHAHPAVVEATKVAAEGAAAPHPDANKPAVQAAVKAVADKAAQAASAAPAGSSTQQVHAAATQAAQTAAAEHPAVADHPAVQAATKAAATAATAATAGKPPGTAGVGFPPRSTRPIGPTALPAKSGPQPAQTECGCLDDSPYLGFVGDEEENDLLYPLN
jgi:hypothetical protein